MTDSLSLMRPDTRALLGWLVRRYGRAQFGRLALAGACMVVTAVTAAGFAWLAKPALDEVFQNHDPTMQLLIPLAVLAVVSVNGGALYAQNMLLQSVGQRVTAGLQVELFEHFVRADLQRLSEVNSGKLVSRCVYDSMQLEAAVSDLLVAILRDLLMVVFLTAVMLLRDWKMTLATILILPALGFGMRKIGRRSRQASSGMLEETEKMIARFGEAFAGARLVKVYDAEAREVARARVIAEARRKWCMRMARNRYLTSPMTEVLTGVALALTIFYGGWRAGQGELTIGALGSFLAALVLCYRPLKRLAQLNASFQEGMAAAERIRDALAIRPGILAEPGAPALKVAGGGVRFERVGFAYGAERGVLDGFELTVPPGKAVALVGPSGAGKSTVLNLIARLYDPHEGRVTIDGQDVRAVSLESLRAAIGLVTQDTILFDDTIRANIAYGRPDADDEAVKAAARAADAAQFIEALPQGYDTFVGERGVKLSGGQRQRIAIARAILKDAPILLLDEATSSLDGESELAVKRALQRAMRGRTTVIVSHRLSTVSDADEIHVLVAGRIVETGRHAQLLARRGYYARLYAQQAGEGEAEAEPSAAAGA
ncbi:MAG: ABC transporter ATP-binding protein [Alphaproteobacteria bacterium]|nr:ABC transporter ATP-binding protein [Alphaproteobacteria bacterium]